MKSIAMEQKKGPRDFSVNIAERFLWQIVNLKRHRTIHTGEENPRRFQCDQCGKCFEHKMNLQRHVLIHTGDRPFECKHCGMKFNQDTARDRHVKLHFKHGEYRDVIKHHVTVKKGQGWTAVCTLVKRKGLNVLQSTLRKSNPLGLKKLLRL